MDSRYELYKTGVFLVLRLEGRKEHIKVFSRAFHRFIRPDDENDVEHFPNRLAERYRGRRVKVSGEVKMYRSEAEMILDDPSQLEIYPE